MPWPLSPDVILSDVQMPRMDGWQQLVRIIRARSALVRVPMRDFLMRLRGEGRATRKVTRLGRRFRTKPSRPEELRAASTGPVARTRQPSRHPRQKRLAEDLTGPFLEQVPRWPRLLSFLDSRESTGILSLAREMDEVLRSTSSRDNRGRRSSTVPSPSNRRASDWPSCSTGTMAQFEFAQAAVACADEVCVSWNVALLYHARENDEEAR